MLIGYARVSKADGTQTSDLQRDALIAAGVDAARIYEDRASGGHAIERDEIYAKRTKLEHYAAAGVVSLSEAAVPPLGDVDPSDQM